MSGLLICSECSGPLIVISGTGKYATYGCSRAFNRAVCSNRAKIKESHLEQKLFAQLHTAFNTPEVLDSLVESLIQFQGELLAGTELAQRIQELETQLRNLIGELAQIGGSEALRAGIRQREEELKGLKALKSNRKELSPAEITKKVKEALRDIPTLFKADPLLAKAKLAEHLDHITMRPQPDGVYLVEGEWDLLGAGFAPQIGCGGRICSQDPISPQDRTHRARSRQSIEENQLGPKSGSRDWLALVSHAGRRCLSQGDQRADPRSLGVP